MQPEDKKPLFILTMAPFPDQEREPGWTGGPAMIPAARLAVNQINNRSDILQDYTLKLLEADSGCHLVDKTILNFINQTFHVSAEQNLNLVGIVGPGCSEAATYIARHIVHPLLNFMEISIATTPSIDIRADVQRFNNSFRTVASSILIVDGFLELAKKANWTIVGALYDESRDYHALTFSAFRNKTRQNEIKLEHFTLRNLALNTTLQNIKNHGIRAYFVFSGRDLAREFLCAAYKMGLIYPSIQYVFIERVENDFLQGSTNCNSTEMRNALNGTIFFNYQHQRTDTSSNKTEAKISYETYDSLYDKYLHEYLREINIKMNDLPSTARIFKNGYYDAVWAFALALNMTMQVHDLTKYMVGSQNLEIGNSMRENLLNLEFQGMSGLVSFNPETRDVRTLGATLNQSIMIQDETIYYTGHYYSNNTLNFSTENFTVESTFAYITQKVGMTLGISILIVCTVLVLILVMLQIAYCKYANVRELKATSPYLSYFIFSGCYLFIISLIVFIIQEVEGMSPDSPDPVIFGVECSLQVWCIALGFDLIFGTICAKTWRIYRIFSHFRHGPVRFVSDEILVLFIACLIACDLAFLSAWNVVNPWKLRKLITRKNAVTEIRQNICECDNFLTWSIALYVLKSFIMALAVFLSLLIRRVKRKGFKSAKTTIILVYVLTFFYSLGILSLFLGGNNNMIVVFLLNFVSVIGSVIAVCCTVFLASLWPVFLLKYPTLQTIKFKRNKSTN